MRAFRVIISLFALVSALPAAKKTLDVYFIDVEGGQATLFVSPDHQSMLVDTGWGNYNGRDAGRIAAAAKASGIKKIDYLVITHYHSDHVGGVQNLLEKMPVLNFVDHGPTVEPDKKAYLAYEKAIGSAHHIVVKAGDTIPVKGLEVRVVEANGDSIASPMPSAGAKNPACGKEARKEADPSENAASVGTYITFGKFRIVDLGDLTWNKELDLMCPVARIAPVDVYLSTHHGLSMSGPEAMVHALDPRVAIMNNGAKKGGAPEAWKVIRSSPHLEDLWQLHFSLAGGKETNSPDVFVANPEERCEGKYLKLSAFADGSFSVTNSRNKYSKTYAAR